MSASHATSDKRSRRAAIAALVVGLLVLYVLGLGPFSWAIRSRWLPDEFGNLYLPLGWLAQRSVMVRDAIEWYLDWWKP
jgi:hypothetical protein